MQKDGRIGPPYTFRRDPSHVFHIAYRLAVDLIASAVGQPEASQINLRQGQVMIVQAWPSVERMVYYRRPELARQVLRRSSRNLTDSVQPSKRKYGGIDLIVIR